MVEHSLPPPLFLFICSLEATYHYVAQAYLQLRILPASVSQVPASQLCVPFGAETAPIKPRGYERNAFKVRLQAGLGRNESLML